jgi:hypothetical protein
MTASVVPHDVEHWIIWSRVPIVNPSNERIDKLGLWGFTGTEGCEPVILPEGVTLPPSPTQEEAEIIRGACQELEKCVRARWPEPLWECAWFMNPPVSTSLVFTTNSESDLCAQATAKHSGPRSRPRLRTTQDVAFNRPMNNRCLSRNDRRFIFLPYAQKTA